MTEDEIEVAQVQDYFGELGVAALRITTGPLCVGDVLHFKGHTTDLLQEISSMQADHHQVREARTGEVVGVKVLERVRQHDRVYKVFLEEHI
ncbi:translation elongation factor-like protein [bacterium]|nr:translation elongation factor-like protein [bacterium]